MTCFFDGDSISVRLMLWVREKIESSAVKLIIVAEEGRRLPKDLRDFIQYVPQGPNAADFEILKQCKSGDMVCTRDFVLAQKALEIGAYAMNNEGLIFTVEYLKMRINESRLNLALKAGGHESYRAQNRSKSAHQREFENSFDKWLKETV